MGLFSYWVQDINVHCDVHVAVADSVFELLDNSFGTKLIDISCCDNLKSTLGIIFQICMLATEWRTNPGMNGGVVRDQAFLMRNVKKCSLSHSSTTLYSPRVIISEQRPRKRPS